MKNYDIDYKMFKKIDQSDNCETVWYASALETSPDSLIFFIWFLGYVIFEVQMNKRSTKKD